VKGRIDRSRSDAGADAGHVVPHLGEWLRHHPRPAALVARRRRLRFAYSDGAACAELRRG